MLFSSSQSRIESAEPEASRAAACQPPDMATADAAREAPVFPWMIEMVVRVILAGIVSDHLPLVWTWGASGMAGFVGESGCSAGGAACGAALAGAGPGLGMYPPPTSGLPLPCLSRTTRSVSSYNPPKTLILYTNIGEYPWASRVSNATKQSGPNAFERRRTQSESAFAHLREA